MDKTYIAEEFNIGPTEIVICIDKCANTQDEIEEILEKTARDVKPYLIKKAMKEKEEIV